MMKNLLFVLINLLFINVSFAQLYINGTLSTGTTSVSGVAAPAGYDWGEMQTNPAHTVANATAGIPAYYKTDGTTSYAIAEDFTVPNGQIWNVSSLDFFGYQASFSGTTAPIDQMRIAIYNQDPSIAGATPIFGNLTTNVIDIPNCQNAFIYRVFNSLYPSGGQPLNFTRPIWKLRGNITASLPAGHYWVEFQVHPTNNTNIFFPPTVIQGVRGIIGANAKIHTLASTFSGDTIGWSASILDNGVPVTNPGVAQEFPFNVNGTITNLATSQFELDKMITIFPNPTNGILNINFPEGFIFNEIKITDLNGRIIKIFNGNEISDNRIDIQNIEKGVYLIEINSFFGNVLKKLVKN